MSKQINFSKYDTKTLIMAREYLFNVFTGTYIPSGRKTTLLDTIISKLDRLLKEYGSDNEVNLFFGKIYEDDNKDEIDTLPVKDAASVVQKEIDKEGHMSYKYFISYMFKPHDGKPYISLDALPTATCEVVRENPISSTFDVNDLEEDIRADKDYEFVMVIAFSRFE